MIILPTTERIKEQRNVVSVCFTATVTKCQTLFMAYKQKKKLSFMYGRPTSVVLPPPSVLDVFQKFKSLMDVSLHKAATFSMWIGCQNVMYLSSCSLNGGTILGDCRTFRMREVGHWRASLKCYSPDPFRLQSFCFLVKAMRQAAAACSCDGPFCHHACLFKPQAQGSPLFPMLLLSGIITEMTDIINTYVVFHPSLFYLACILFLWLFLLETESNVTQVGLELTVWSWGCMNTAAVHHHA